ncbi:MAG: MFS transporter [Chitinophagales bacterium]|nr:MFS transporter [Chitinophagales bacterium]MDW8418700.1 MFS transporter [Chitinophagales bacterium]
MRSQDAYAALRIEDFRHFQLSRFLLTMSIQMAETVISWRVYEITGSKMALGWIGLSEAIPFILTSLVGGYVADKFNRFHIARATIVGFILTFGSLGWLMSGNNPIVSAYGVAPVYLLIGVGGIVRGFMAPAFQSIFPQIVPRALYANAATWASNTWQTAAVAGPALGGIIYGHTGAATAFTVSVGCMLCSFFVFLLVTEKPQTHAVKQESFLASFTSGLKFVFSQRAMLGAITLDLFAVLFGGAVALLPVFAKDILHVGPKGLGFLRAAPFLGSVMMGVVLAYFPPTAHAGRNLMWAVIGFGLATIGFALSKNYYLSLFMLFLTGAFDNVSVVIRQTILQTFTPDTMRGRVSAVNQIFIASSNEIGAFESSLAATLMGTVPSVVFGGCMTLLVVAVIYHAIPQLRALRL